MLDPVGTHLFPLPTDFLNSSRWAAGVAQGEVVCAVFWNARQCQFGRLRLQEDLRGTRDGYRRSGLWWGEVWDWDAGTREPLFVDRLGRGGRTEAKTAGRGCRSGQVWKVGMKESHEAGRRCDVSTRVLWHVVDKGSQPACGPALNRVRGQYFGMDLSRCG